MNKNFTLGLNPHTINLTDLFMSGLHWMHVVAERNSDIRFSNWAQLMNQARCKSNNLKAEKLIWLWEAIISEPEIKKKFSNQIRSIEDDWKMLDPIECLPAKSLLGVFLKNLSTLGYPVMPISQDIKPDAELEILQPLSMKPGKAGRLECCDVRTRLNLGINPLESVEAEAAVLKVDKENIEIQDNCVIVEVKSLNHAYTTASLRLEPYRRSHGGRIYDHIALIQINNCYRPLEYIRVEHEKSLWSNLIGN